MTHCAHASRVALVTGASRGIGAATASALLAAGHQVAGLSRSGQAPDGVLALACDVADPKAVDAAVSEIEDQLGAVQILVANAGQNADELALRMSDESWQRIIDVNLTGAFNVSRRVLRGMLAARFGRIVLVSSVAALHGSAGQVNYAAAKAGLVGLSRSLAREVAGRGITVNTVHPGFIDTAMTAALPAEILQERVDEIPVGRVGQVDEVVAAIEFLVSDRASYLTGAIIPVDGGLGMGQ